MPLRPCRDRPSGGAAAQNGVHVERWVLRVVADDLRDVVVRVLGPLATQDVALDGIGIRRCSEDPLVRLRFEFRASERTIRTVVRLVRRLVCVTRVEVLRGRTLSVDRGTQVTPRGEHFERARRPQHEGVSEAGGNDLKTHG